jgi:transposase
MIGKQSGRGDELDMPRVEERLHGITKAGNGYLREMLMVGAIAVIRYAQRKSAGRPWLVELMGRRPIKVAAIALANKTARTRSASSSRWTCA